nr:hypothetical protein CFP56_00475 [Quercus suber]
MAGAAPITSRARMQAKIGSYGGTAGHSWQNENCTRSTSVSIVGEWKVEEAANAADPQSSYTTPGFYQRRTHVSVSSYISFELSDAVRTV